MPYSCDSVGRNCELTLNYVYEYDSFDCISCTPLTCQMSHDRTLRLVSAIGNATLTRYALPPVSCSRTRVRWRCSRTGTSPLEAQCSSRLKRRRSSVVGRHVLLVLVVPVITDEPLIRNEPLRHGDWY